MRQTCGPLSIIVGFTFAALVASETFLSGQTARLVVLPPASGLIGDALTIEASGLAPGEPYSLNLTLEDYWGGRARSRAVFLADAKGTVDITRDAPIVGHYSGVDPLGLFWSADIVEGPAQVTPTTPPRAAMTVNIELRAAMGTALTGTTTLWLMAPGTSRLPYQRDGVRGVLYSGEKKSTTGVVLLGGSGGGLNWQEVTAAALASRGYASLALGYFNVDPLPRELERVPIDGVLAAIDEFPKLAGVDRVVVAGLSKGAELALLVSSMNKTVRGVIAFAPSSTVFQSFPSMIKLTTPASSWTLNGKDITYAPLQRERTSLPGEPGDRAWLDYLILHSTAVEAAAIPVERINGPLLLFSGSEDRIWPSRVMADQIVSRLRERQFQHRVQHITFQDVGHAFATPGYLPTSRTALNNGGSPRATAWAQTTSWAALQRFLDALSN